MIINLPSIFEGALAATITVNAEIQPSEFPRLRTWQALDAEARWSTEDDRHFPMIGIRASPPTVGDDRRTFHVPVEVLVGTNAADDRDHAQLSRLYAAVQEIIDALYSEYINEAKAVRTAFDQHISDQMAGADYDLHLGGIEYGDPMSPYNEDGINYIGLNINVHYSRSNV